MITEDKMVEKKKKKNSKNPPKMDLLMTMNTRIEIDVALVGKKIEGDQLAVLQRLHVEKYMTVLRPVTVVHRPT